jgi:peroxiredoxin Q/BCP
MPDRSAPLNAGEAAPDLTLPDHAGRDVRLSSLWSQGPLVVFFYPADETYGCTKEACAFRDGHQRFVDAGAAVVGISGDSEESHRRFREHHGLPFVLLSDNKGEARAQFGVKPLLGLFEGRVTFVIDTRGIVRDVFASRVQFERHAERALAAVAAAKR